MTAFSLAQGHKYKAHERDGRTLYLAVMANQSKLANHQPRLKQLIRLPFLTKKITLAQGHRYGVPSEDRAHNTIVMDNKTNLANHYPMPKQSMK